MLGGRLRFFRVDYRSIFYIIACLDYKLRKVKKSRHHSINLYSVNYVTQAFFLHFHSTDLTPRTEESLGYFIYIMIRRYVCTDMGSPFWSLDWLRNWLLIKNPQFLPNQADILVIFFYSPSQ